MLWFRRAFVGALFVNVSIVHAGAADPTRPTLIIARVNERLQNSFMISGVNTKWYNEVYPTIKDVDFDNVQGFQLGEGAPMEYLMSDYGQDLLIIVGSRPGNPEMSVYHEGVWDPLPAGGQWSKPIQTEESDKNRRQYQLQIKIGEKTTQLNLLWRPAPAA